MVLYLQASDIHGTDRVRTVIETANSIKGLDAIMLLGDLVDRQSEEFGQDGRKGYEYMSLASKAVEPALKARSKLAQDLHQGFDLNLVGLLQQGGPDLLYGVANRLQGTDEFAEIQRLIREFESRKEEYANLGRVLEDRLQSGEFSEQLQGVREESAKIVPAAMSSIVERQYHDRLALDDIFSSAKAPVYVGDGNHDGQALRDLKHATNMGQLMYALEIGGVKFAYEPNTRENILAGPLLSDGLLQPEDVEAAIATFYDGTPSMIGNEYTTKGWVREAKMAQERFGIPAEEFLARYFQKSQILNRLNTIGSVDVMLMHNPVGGHAFVGEKFIDYSIALHKYLEETKPTVLGWGHLHGQGAFHDKNDPTFGYSYQGVHSTDDFFYLVDVDPKTKKVRWYEKFEIVD